MTRQSPTEPAQFDVRAFARTAQGSLRDDLDLTAFAAVTLTPDVVRVLAAIGTLEGATMAHLRNVLVTPTHKDARVTAFLVTWAFEKFWIADALQAIVEANGGDADAAKARARSKSTAATSGGRGPVGRALAGLLQGGHVVGGHMTAGLVDDWMLRAAYERTVETAANGALDDAVARILVVKERHTRFFQEEAARRLTASPKAVRLARRELRRTAWPLGSVTLAPTARDAFTAFVFADVKGEMLAARIEQQIAGIPGIDARTAAIVRAKLADPPAD